ncbi:putative phytochrome sensor protein [Hyella patelloides LEGE 07179]|uniref:Putative phytochrome sensor protein n=1 Tax=Hyella patelloides LEGE 07179 TaxID=945734 RepID=A0A563VZ04_9CYAN|nr:GAF domain-containing protein [Hyella patelloides]VEP16661.1 putative phytochrome sensor protein [Hyella patelloides LEGE 07179]
MVNQTNQLLEEIAQRVRELLNAETAVVAEAFEKEEVLYYTAAVGKHASIIKGKRGAIATSGLCGTAIKSNCPILVTKTTGDTRIRQDYVQSLGIYTALAVPLQYQGKLLGAIMVLNRIDGSLFDEKTEKLLADYAVEVCPSLYKSQR